MIKATVTSDETVVKSGTSRAGKPYSITEQEVLLELPNGERRRHRLSLEANEMPLIKGTYQPKPTAVYLDKFDLKVSSRARDWAKV